MEHIVQFAIGIDDEGIKKAVTENAEKTIIKELSEEVKRILFKKDFSYKNGLSLGPTQYMDEKIGAILDENREAIIEAAAEKLADKLSRTKKAKEMLGEVLEKGE